MRRLAAALALVLARGAGTPLVNHSDIISGGGRAGPHAWLGEHADVVCRSPADLAPLFDADRCGGAADAAGAGAARALVVQIPMPTAHEARAAAAERCACVLLAEAASVRCAFVLVMLGDRIDPSVEATTLLPL